MVIGLSLNNFMNHAQGKGVIGAGTNLKETTCFYACHGLADINVGELAAFFQHIQGLNVFCNAQRGKHVATEEDQMVGIFDVINEPFPADPVDGQRSMVCISAAGVVMIRVVR